MASFTSFLSLLALPTVTSLEEMSKILGRESSKSGRRKDYRFVSHRKGNKHGKILQSIPYSDSRSKSSNKWYSSGVQCSTGNYLKRTAAATANLETAAARTTPLTLIDLVVGSVTVRKGRIQLEATRDDCRIWKKAKSASFLGSMMRMGGGGGGREGGRGRNGDAAFFSLHNDCTLHRLFFDTETFHAYF